MLFKLDFTDDSILSCSFFLVLDSYFLIPAAIAQIFNPVSELVIPIGIPLKEPKAENEIHLQLFTKYFVLTLVFM